MRPSIFAKTHSDRWIRVLVTATLVWTTGCPDEPEDDDATVGMAHGEPCAGDDDCQSGLRCAGNGTCLYPKEPGTASEGEACVATQYCRWGLVCNHEGLCAQSGTDGTGGAGAVCTTDADCEATFWCEDETCRGYGIPLWPGVTCTDPEEDSGPFRVLFEVPGDTPPSEFYRLPFPNDIRTRDGRPDLSGHPSPGLLDPDLGDVVGAAIQTLEEQVSGFGNNAAIYFRFSDRPAYDTLTLGYADQGATVYVVDVTAGSPSFGQEQAIAYYADSNPGKYICSNWLAIVNGPGRPFEAGHTYAAVITTGVLSRDEATPLEQDTDFAPLLDPDPPDDPRLETAWAVYAPLRDWLNAADIAPDTIGAAAVFTVQDPAPDFDAVREAVRAADPPDPSGLHLCEEGDPGPYADDGDPDRGCTEVSEAFFEIQGTLDIPTFQDGTPPYKALEDGGDLHDQGNGAVTPSGTETVVFSLTIPRAERPAEGWPLILFAHGTFGNYRTFVTEGLADLFSNVETDDGTRVRFAILGIDQVLNGPRAHPENWSDTWLERDPGAYDPDLLFYNVLNPPAARTNAIQAVADYFYLVRMAESLVWTAEQSPTGEVVSFDSSHVYFLGHGQGAASGVPFLAHEPGVEAAVLAGAGASLADWLPDKTLPDHLPDLVRAALADPDIARIHPAVNLLQAALERVDPVDPAGAVMRTPTETVGPHHLLMLHAADDPYVPESIQYALVKGLRLPQLTNGLAPLDNVSTVNGDVSGNVWSGGTSVTAAVTLYNPDQGNPHFVLYQDDDARYQMSQFLATSVRDGVPTIPAL